MHSNTLCHMNSTHFCISKDRKEKRGENVRRSILELLLLYQIGELDSPPRCKPLSRNSPRLLSLGNHSLLLFHKSGFLSTMFLKTVQNFSQRNSTPPFLILASHSFSRIRLSGLVFLLEILFFFNVPGTVILWIFGLAFAISSPSCPYEGWPPKFNLKCNPLRWCTNLGPTMNSHFWTCSFPLKRLHSFSKHFSWVHQHCVFSH